jgi:hypothetical protein
MKRTVMLAAITGLLSSALSGCGDNQKKAVSEIRKLGGRVEVDAEAQGRPVIRVEFSHTELKDAELVYLAGLAQLQELDLGFNT